MNSYELFMSVLIGSGENRSFVTIITFLNEWFSLFHAENLSKRKIRSCGLRLVETKLINRDIF